MSEETSRMLLPFAVLAPNRTETFADEVEKAAIFCLAELEREKGGRLVAKQPPEKIDFISKVAYPFWIVPFHETNLIFDGMNTVSHVLSYPDTQDTREFIEGLERTANSRETYTAFLSDNINYFQVSGKATSITVEGLIAESVLANDFASYLLEARSFETTQSDVVALPTQIAEDFTAEKVHELESLKTTFELEIKNLNKSMRLLSATTKGFAKAIRVEIKEVRDKFNEELEKLRGPAEEEVRKIRRTGDEETATVSGRYERELLRIQKEKMKHEKTKDSLSQKIARCEAEIKTSKANKDKTGERRWKEEKGERKKERSEVESQIKKFEKDLKETENQREQELFKIKSEIDTRIREATKELEETESSRDAKIQVLKQETQKIEELSSTIIKQIDTAAKQKEASSSSFDKLGIPQKHNKQLIVYVPFYLIGFQSESRKRYVHYPPSNVNNIKLSVKLKSALGMARVKQLLTPRSEAMATFLSQFPSMLEENAVLEREINEAAAEADILKTRNAKESIMNGLSKLKDEGWLSENDRVTFSQGFI